VCGVDSSTHARLAASVPHLLHVRNLPHLEVVHWATLIISNPHRRLSSANHPRTVRHTHTHTHIHTWNPHKQLSSSHPTRKLPLLHFQARPERLQQVREKSRVPGAHLHASFVITTSPNAWARLSESHGLGTPLTHRAQVAS
jgi:hypothetical protein